MLLRAALIFALFMIIGCASSSGTKVQAKTDDGNVVTTYDDPKYGLRLTYPGDWQEQSIPFMMRPKGTIIVLIAPSDVGGSKMPPTLSVVAREMQAGEQLDGLQKQMIDRAQAQISNFKLIEASSAQLGGEPARRVVYTGSKMGISIQVMNVIALHGGRQFGVAYSADPEVFAEQLSAVQRVIDSVQFAAK